VRDDRGADDPASAVVQYVARTQEPVLLHDAADDPRFFRASARPRSVLCVPLRKGHQLVGVLYLQSTVVTGAFTEDRYEMVTVMAAQAAVSIENARLYDDLRASLQRQQKLTAAFERFMPNQFLEQLEKPDILDVALGDQSQREVTVLFCDLRGFSALASQLGPSGTFAFINRYLGYMEPVIHAHGGFINQYLGDGIMALFPGSTDQAVAGALAMMNALAGFNAERRAAGLPEVRVSIGLNSGPLMLGVIGGSKRFDRGVVGDAVNLASRVEGMTRQFNAPVLIGGETCTRLRERGRFHLRSLGWVAPVGQRKPIEVFEALDVHGADRRTAGAASAGDYAAGLERWVAADFAAAIQHFSACLARDPADGAARFMVTRCEDLLARPPTGPWDGVIRLVSK
jgi:class 3 adenylate cyclase